ncbi:MAG: sugar ABC transporter ATP-binding protein [Anaerolineales bacterium]|nr:sugar ABC transporter ATP-binding protein [Anaerolineales bacterium]
MVSSSFLEMRDINKNFDGTEALKRVNFNACLGEVHAIIGENGAGKSTLMKILSGALQRDAGEIILNGVPAVIKSPIQAHQLGIRAVYQEFSLVPHLSITENIFLGQMPKGRNNRFIDWKRAHKLAEEKLAEIGFTSVDVRTPVSQLSVSHQQMVEIAKAAVTQPRIWILDEPSAVLSQEELDRLFAMIQILKKESTLILYISHRLEEVFRIADRITVLKDGELMGTVLPQETNEGQLIKMMVGRTLGEIFPKRNKVPGEKILELKGLTREGSFRDISLSLAKGEILGLFGLVGSGRTQVARCIFGADPITGGIIYLAGKKFNPKSPHSAVEAGIAFLTEDRKRDGLVMSCSIGDNVSLATMKQVSRFGILNIQQRDARVQDQIQSLSINPPDIKRLVRQLSGGNQQKVILAKWLLSEAKLLILDEPTRGVDVATKVEIYHIIKELAERGTGILLISSELPEILGMSDRAIVFRDGCLVGEFARDEASEERLLASAAGVS